MRYFWWVLRIILFIVLFGFAVNNTENTALRFYLNYEWEAPLVLILLIFFVVGVASGVFASLGHIFKQKREILALKKELRANAQNAERNLSPDSKIIDAI